MPANRKTTSERRRPKGDPYKAERIAGEMTELGVSFLSAFNIDLAPSRFREVFRRAIKETPARHLRRLRVREARRYLMATGLSCKEIALRCGFANLAYFFRTFKQMSGQTPKEFRRAPRPSE